MCISPFSSAPPAVASWSSRGTFGGASWGAEDLLWDYPAMRCSEGSSTGSAQALPLEGKCPYFRNFPNPWHFCCCLTLVSDILSFVQLIWHIIHPIIFGPSKNLTYMDLTLFHRSLAHWQIFMGLKRNRIMTFTCFPDSENCIIRGFSIGSTVSELYFQAD